MNGTGANGVASGTGAAVLAATGLPELLPSLIAGLLLAVTGAVLVTRRRRKAD